MAVAGRVRLGGCAGWWRRSAAGGSERFEVLEGGEQLGRPRPGVLEVKLAATAGEREPPGDMQQPVADPFGLGLGELAVESERLGPDDQVVREHHDLQPHLVERELFERELGQAGVLVVTDAVLDMRVLAVTALDDGDVLVGLVGQDRLEAIAIMVGERQLRAGVRALAPDDQPAALTPGGQIDAIGDLGDLPVLALRERPGLTREPTRPWESPGPRRGRGRSARSRPRTACRHHGSNR